MTQKQMLTILNWVVIGDDSQMMTLHEHELEPPPCYRLAHIVSLFIIYEPREPLLCIYLHLGRGVTLFSL
jgi:hypothetical protein